MPAAAELVRLVPRWTDKLSRTIRDAKDGATLRTRDDARRYMAALPRLATRPYLPIPLSSELLSLRASRFISRQVRNSV
jgi:hypothetical protein